MTLGEFIKMCNENFAEHMNKELRIAVEGRGDHAACRPLLILSPFDKFITIPASGTKAEEYFFGGKKHENTTYEKIQR